MAVTFDPADPASWPALPQPFLVHDFGGAQDYSTIIVGGVAPWSRGVVGATRIERLPLRMTSAETVERLAEADRELGHCATVIVDASGNSAHAEAAAAFGRRCIGVRITAAHDHALCPQPVPFTVGGKRALMRVHVHPGGGQGLGESVVIDAFEGDPVPRYWLWYGVNTGIRRSRKPVRKGERKVRFQPGSGRLSGDRRGSEPRQRDRA